jgi:predicted negative regulator of RcsB-dependent stress response
MKEWVKRYRWWLIAAAAVIVLAIGGWIGWKWALAVLGIAGAGAGGAVKQIIERQEDREAEARELEQRYQDLAGEAKKTDQMYEDYKRRRNQR